MYFNFKIDNKISIIFNYLHLIKMKISHTQKLLKTKTYR